jgi:uncharacterized protein (TIGR03435 family)
MNRRTDEVLNQFLSEFGNPPEHAIENSRENLLDLFASSNVQLLEVVEMPVPPTQPFRFAWAAGMALAAVLVSVLVWNQGPPFSVSTAKNDDRTVAKLSAEEAGVTLPLTVAQDAFEVASVKLVAPSSQAGTMAQRFDQMQSLLAGCSSGYAGGTRLDPGRLTVPAATVLTLVMVAYGQDCLTAEAGPAWATSEHYEVSALLPAGTPRYTTQDLAKGEAPEVQRMLQKLLADRFRLVLKRELREMPVYTLSVGTPGKIKLSPDETRLPNVSPPPGFPPPAAMGRGQNVNFVLPGKHQLSGHAVSMLTLVKSLRQPARRIVIDRTGFSGLLDYDLEFSSEIPPPAGAADPPGTAPLPTSVPPVPGTSLLSLRDALAEQLGLKLEVAKMPVEVLVIQSVERPSEN